MGLGQHAHRRWRRCDLGTCAVIIGLALLGWRIRRFRYRFMLPALALFLPACVLFLSGSPLRRNYQGPGWWAGTVARALAPGLWEGLALGFLALFVLGIYASWASSRKKVKSSADLAALRRANEYPSNKEDRAGE